MRRRTPFIYPAIDGDSLTAGQNVEPTATAVGLQGEVRR
jgi:hypothetical protein